MMMCFVVGCGSESDLTLSQNRNILYQVRAPLGKIGQEARDMAVEEINAAGGINQ